MSLLEEIKRIFEGDGKVELKCEKCGNMLSEQADFDPAANEWICEKCGYKTSFETPEIKW